MKKTASELYKTKSALQEKLQALQKAYQEQREPLLAERALLGEGVSDMAELIGYDEGGKIHKRVDWRLNLIIARHKKKYPKEKCIIAINCFRGFGKSTLYNRVRLIKKAIKKPYESNLLVSSKRDLAKAMLSPIKRILATNPRIRKYYPNTVGTLKWSADEILVAQAESMENPDNNYTIETFGVDSAIASKRYHEIIVDDIIGKQNIVNSKDLEMAAKTLPLLIPLLHPGGVLIILFMRWGKNDWYEENVLEKFKNSKHFHLIRITDVEVNEEGNPINKYGEVVGEDSPERIPVYPEKYPLSYLDNEREIMKDLYYAHYRQFPKKTENKVLDPEFLVEMDEEEYLMSIDNVRTGKIPRSELRLFVDNANTVSKQSNPWSISLWRYNGNNLDMLYFRKTKYSLDAVSTELALLAQKFNLSDIHGEKSGLIGNLQFYLRQKLNKLGLKHVNLVEESHEGTNKKVRILAMQPFLNIRAVRVPPKKYCFYPYEMKGEKVNQLKLLKEEMEMFPDDASNIPDDLIDSFGFVPRMFNIETEYFDTSVMNPKKTAKEEIDEEERLRREAWDPPETQTDYEDPDSGGEKVIEL
ncbi:MAG TPA: hypothetical protein ENN55_00630 [Firmicutes bacterium]|nr:hypothetical protein [Bacillota bacterium]